MDAEMLDHAGTRSESAARPPSVITIMLQIAALKAALNTIGFERTWRYLRSNAQRKSLRYKVAPPLIARIEYKVALAAALFPGRALCLERSLILYSVLRSRGVPVQYRMGVQMHPFAAHAWVELDGEVLNDVAEHVRRYRPFSDIGS